MGVCSYLVFPEHGAAEAVAARLAAISGCEVTAAENREVLLLVTEADGPEREKALRSELEQVDGVLAMMLAFGELDPDAPASASGAAREEGQS
jgi:nitrate reductase NapAB chaperone NapD